MVVRVQSWQGASEQKERSMGRYVGMKHRDVIGQLLILPFVGSHFVPGRGDAVWTELDPEEPCMPRATQEFGITFPPVFRMCRNVTWPEPCPSGS